MSVGELSHNEEVLAGYLRLQNSAMVIRATCNQAAEQSGNRAKGLMDWANVNLGLARRGIVIAKVKEGILSSDELVGILHDEHDDFFPL